MAMTFSCMKNRTVSIKKPSNARICMLTDVGSGINLEPTKGTGEAAPEL